MISSRNVAPPYGATPNCHVDDEPLIYGYEVTVAWLIVVGGWLAEQSRLKG